MPKATFSAAVSMAVRDNADDEGPIHPGDYSRVIGRITTKLCGQDPFPEDDRGGVRWEARLSHMGEFFWGGSSDEEDDSSGKSSGGQRCEWS